MVNFCGFFYVLAYTSFSQARRFCFAFYISLKMNHSLNCLNDALVYADYNRNSLTRDNFVIAKEEQNKLEIISDMWDDVQSREP